MSLVGHIVAGVLRHSPAWLLQGKPQVTLAVEVQPVRGRELPPWVPFTKYRELRALEGKPLYWAGESFEVGQDVLLDNGRGDYGYGHILSIDHGAHYPLTVEWTTPEGDKRITACLPDELK